MARRHAVLAILTTLLTVVTYALPSDIPNSVKYSDTGVKASTGRAGSASIEARALLNSDDTTTVEITTGSFEGGSAAGTIAKVQIKVPTDGDPITKNFNDPAAGTFTGNVSGVISGNILGVQANVRDIDPARTDIVEAQVTVAKRPDLWVRAIGTPANVVTGDVGRIRAFIHELNGESGARANCRLLLNGVEVDRAENIWVDAGGTVQCSFAPVLDYEGTVEATVIVDSVNPGDWDTSNNSNTEWFTVYNVRDEFYSWTARVSETEFQFYDYQKRSWTERTRDERGVSQSFHFDGVIRAPFDLANFSLTAEGSTDGNPLFAKSAEDFVVFNTPVRTTCARTVGSPEVIACRSMDGGPVDVEVSFGVADAIYRSWGWATRQHPFAPDGPKFFWNDTRVEDSLQSRLGNTAALRFTASDGTGEWTAEPFIASWTTSSFSSVRPYRCSFDFFTEETVCRESRNIQKTRSGSASGFAQ